MAMKILLDECTACGDCEPVCPNVAITQKAGNYRINADKCTECEDEDSPKCVAVCPGGENTIVYL